MKLGKVKKVHRFEFLKAFYKFIFSVFSSIILYLFRFVLGLKTILSLFKFKFNKKILYTLSTFLIIFPFLSYNFFVDLFKVSSGAETKNQFSSLEPNFVAIPVSEKIEIGKAEFINLDKRTYVYEEYFKANNSPLVGTASKFVEACDRYKASADCISVIAIAKHETDLCKYYTSASMYNCFGWGGGGEYRVRFKSYDDMINTVFDVLVNQYGIAYMDDPRKMEKVFCGPQDECIGWGSRVLNIMGNIDRFSENLGVGRLTDLRTDGLRF